MKIQVLSDLHNEFLRSPRLIPRVPDVDVVVLAGDIDVDCRGLEWARRTFQGRVIYVPGNHEFYGFDFDATRERMQAVADSLGIDLLDPGVVEIDGVVFVGATLWTDFELFGNREREMSIAKKGLNDFRVIKGFSPARSLTRHEEERAFIERELEKHRGRKIVVVTHHLPSWQSVAERYRGDKLAAAFASHLDELIEREQPRLWIHGHTHDGFDYVVGETRVICNPGGYPDEPDNPRFDLRMVVEI
ncbi:MAG: metallophosphoesterase family protein [Rhodocyclaceae bacterium]|nr:metallophosphoesterase family protein [Rhodocyclaceae bacterium]